MDRRKVDGWMDGWMDGWNYSRKEGRKEGRIGRNERINKLT